MHALQPAHPSPPAQAGPLNGRPGDVNVDAARSPGQALTTVGGDVNADQTAALERDLAAVRRTVNAFARVHCGWIAAGLYPEACAEMTAAVRQAAQ